MEAETSGHRAGLRRKLLLAGASALLAVLALLLAGELAAGWLLGHPPGPGPVLRALRGHYAQRERAIIQYLPECARFDPGLGYTLRPGAFRFANREFDNAWRVNSLGVRGPEEDLAGPRLAVLGDSFASGWGVEEAETFGRILGETLGRRALLAAVSSYGTARELLLLARADTTRLDIVVLQYCSNDLEENEAFLAGGGNLATMGEDVFRTTCADHARTRRLLPGARAVRVWSDVLRELGQELRGAVRGPAPRDLAHEADVLVRVLERSPAPLAGKALVVLSLDPACANPREFAAALRRRLDAPETPAWLRPARVLDTSFLGPEHAYALDDHLNAAGHRAVAARLAELLAAP